MKSRFSKLTEELDQQKWLMLLCLILAFLSWQAIHNNSGFEVPVANVAIDVDVPEGWAVWEKSIPHVNILFRGSSEDIRFLNSGQLRVVIPISDPKAGNELHIRLQEKYLKNPTGAKVVRFSPSEIYVKLDREGERILPVKAALEDALPDGLEVGRIICSPASVRVSGAEQLLGDMQNIQTEPIKLSDRQASFKESVPIAMPQVGRLHVVPDWVSVEMVIEQHTSTQVLTDVPVRMLCASGETRAMTIEPTKIHATVKGQQKRIEQMLPQDVFAYVNCSALLENTSYDLPVTVKLPAGIQLIKTEPATVHVSVNK